VATDCTINNFIFNNIFLFKVNSDKLEHKQNFNFETIYNNKRVFINIMTFKLVDTIMKAI
jgi:hypothetical protein